MRSSLPALTLVAALASGLLACPSLSEIGVGRADAGADSQPDHAADVMPRDTGVPEALGDTTACTADAASDPTNCGRCAHDCKGGACNGGVCQPYAIVTGISRPQGVAVNNGVVYFTDLILSVEKCVADDCGGTLTQIASSQGIPAGITTDTTSVYWTNAGFPDDAGYGGSIATCGLSGCPGKPTVLAPSEDRPVDIAVDTAAVYWTDDVGGLVRSCAIGTCNNMMPVTLATDPTSLSGIAIDATSVYWAETTLGNIIKCPLAGCGTFTPFASGQVGPAKIDIAMGTVFWSTNGAIMSCPAAGCGGAPRVFAKNQPSAYAIAHDTTNLYWTLAEPNGKVLTCPLAGCTAPTVLGDMQDTPLALAVDTSVPGVTSVYWANSGGDTVMRVIK